MLLMVKLEVIMVGFTFTLNEDQWYTVGKLRELTDEKMNAFRGPKICWSKVIPLKSAHRQNVSTGLFGQTSMANHKKSKIQLIKYLGFNSRAEEPLITEKLVSAFRTEPAKRAIRGEDGNTPMRKGNGCRNSPHHSPPGEAQHLRGDLFSPINHSHSGGGFEIVMKSEAMFHTTAIDLR
ncbi:hypothetical protein LXL04_032105 [Taraxacum kok-saghyz]